MTSSPEVVAVAARAASRVSFALSKAYSAVARAVFLTSIAAYASTTCLLNAASKALSLANKVSLNFWAAAAFVVSAAAAAATALSREILAAVCAATASAAVLSAIPLSTSAFSASILA